MDGWSGSWFVGWSVRRSLDCLASQPVGELVGWLDRGSVSQMVGSGWLVDQSVRQAVG